MIKYHVGDEVKAKIVGIQHYGAFAQISPSLTGLIHISEISDGFVRDVSDYFAIGDDVDAIIIEIDETSNHAKLSIKRLAKNAKRYRQVATKRKPYKCDKMYNFLVIKKFNEEKLKENLNEDSKVKVNFINKNKENKVNYIEYKAKIKEIHRKMHEQLVNSIDTLDWLTLPIKYNEKELLNLVNLSQELRSKFTTLVVYGNSENVLAAKAVINALNDSNDSMEVIYLSDEVELDAVNKILKDLENKDFAINVISNLETSSVLKALKDLLNKKYGKDEAKEHIIGSLDKTLIKDVFSNLNEKGSILSLMGLFPISFVGINVFDILLGAKKAYNDLNNEDIYINPAYQYALNRYHYFKLGYHGETFISDEDKRKHLIEWCKLLANKNNKSNDDLFVTSLTISDEGKVEKESNFVLELAKLDAKIIGYFMYFIELSNAMLDKLFAY